MSGRGVEAIYVVQGLSKNVGVMEFGPSFLKCNVNKHLILSEV